ncbi:MAG: ABC transporter ATP-binding protein [bacterium]
MSSITLTAIAKTFGIVNVLQNVSLDVADGEFVALLGPSGCGKSTLIRIVAGLEKPDAGEVRIGERLVDGPRVHVPPEERGLGMVFQSYAVWPHKTVRGNVAYPLGLRGMDRVEVAEKTARALDLVQLTGLGERYPHELSGGQQQRVALARALVAEPEVLLLDEPLSNLDARLREEMRGELAALRARLGVTVLLVTHDQSEALATADRVAVMRAGRIAQVAAPAVLYDEPADLYVARVLGAVNELPVSAIRHAPEGPELEVETVGGVRMRVSAPRPLPTIEPVVMAFRPEHVALGEGPFAATVEARDYLGSRVELTLAIDTHTIRASVPAVTAPNVGEIVPFRITKARLLPQT